MKRTIISVIVMNLICILIFPITVFASNTGENSINRIVDEANIISEKYYKEIQNKLDTFSEQYKIDIVVVTASDIGNKTSEEYADDYFDYNGYGYDGSKDGILLLISMKPREVAISTSGKCINYFSNEKCDEIIDDIIYYLKSGDYDLASLGFIKNIDSTMKSVKSRPLYLIFISIGIGFFIASKKVSRMKAKLNTVAMKHNAEGYQIPGSMQLYAKDDRFLYNNVSRTKIEKESSSGGGTHTSSSGNSHGGSSRSF